MDRLIPTTHLDMRAFARSAGTLQGLAQLTAFERVACDCHGDVAGIDVEWSARAWLQDSGQEAAQVWLRLQLGAELPLTCQRCLEEVATTIEVDRTFRFVADEETAQAQDDEAAEDLLVLSDVFDLHALVEDELVLAMPLIAQHAVCPGNPVLSATDAGFDAQEDKPGPFAALAGLKLPKGGQAD